MSKRLSGWTMSIAMAANAKLPTADELRLVSRAKQYMLIIEAALTALAGRAMRNT